MTELSKTKKTTAQKSTSITKSKNLELESAVKVPATTSEPEAKIEKIYVERVNDKLNLKQKKTKIPLDYIIGIKSGVQGILEYTSHKSNYRIVISEYGETDTLTFDDLISMRNAHIRYFKDNWIFIEDTEDFSAEEIYEALGVSKYYVEILKMDDLDKVLSLSPDALKKKIENVPNGVKDAIVTRARKLMRDNSDIMDSNKKIKVIEETFNVELVPRDI